ncbi:thiamine diphosphokinase [Fictibacillus terranigra]|uniref:Thiamine diphosphokinase n=1 Tax=Fictibacillus terranigra TaxID=3058424 RepID=A0ABT8E6E8_9BACL|nr:thiamine diphosphokinase [Fictibacillus sp. CENA-BCM004]MDN4073485.1 thiamine diphosphokinase [Fictibacillus sp. CENA-BCM004]
MKIIILAGGPEERQPDFSLFTGKKVIWAGVDRGVFYLLKKGITPDCAFGDFDSVNDEERQWMASFQLPSFEYDSEKDKTDLELALDWALGQNPEQILLLGVTGGRLDHELANIQLLLHGMEAGVSIEIRDKQNRFTLVKPGLHTIQQETDFPYISFLPFNGPVTGLTLKGFKYPLQDQYVPMGSTLCISNELVNKIGTYSFSSGILMLIKSHD